MISYHILRTVGAERDQTRRTDAELHRRVRQASAARRRRRASARKQARRPSVRPGRTRS
jgi:hypothetical protein